MLNEKEIKERLEALKNSKPEELHEVKEAQMIDYWWDKPAEGETLQGIYLESREFRSKIDGSKFKCDVIATEGGVYGVSENVILKKRLHEPANIPPIKEGDGLILTYLGKKQTRNSMNKYHDYKVVIRPFGEPENPEAEGSEAEGPGDSVDVRAGEIVGMLVNELSAEKGGNYEPSLEEIVDRAVKYADDPDCSEVDDKMLTRIKVYIANNQEEAE